MNNQSTAADPPPIATPVPAAPDRPMRNIRIPKRFVTGDVKNHATATTAAPPVAAVAHSCGQIPGASSGPNTLNNHGTAVIDGPHVPGPSADSDECPFFRRLHMRLKALKIPIKTSYYSMIKTTSLRSVENYAKTR